MASSFSAVQHQLRAATLRIAHAHDFSKTSNLAISVLVDLLSGFLELLASASVQHAQLAGRTSFNFYDALAALEELGIDVYEVMQWCRRDGSAMLEYQLPLPRHCNDLAGELAIMLRNFAFTHLHVEVMSVGLGKRNEPSVILEYREVTDSLEDSPELASSDIVPSPTLIPSIPDIDMSDVPFDETSSHGSDAFSPSPNATNPPPDLAEWNELVSQHPHDHLPPLPGACDVTLYQHEPRASYRDRGVMFPPNPVSQSQEPTSGDVKSSRGRLGGRITNSPLYQAPTSYPKSTAAQELFVQLPEPPDREDPVPTASTHPFLLIAMQSAQENMTAGNTNPARLVISSTMSVTATMRYGASDSLFSSSLPPPPRCLAPAPSHPIPQSASAPTILLPPPEPRSIRSPLSDALDPQPGSLSTHMNALAERVIKPAVQDRSSMILPPVAFIDNNTPYLYGNPARAPWNKANGQQSRSDKPSGLTDALLYRTWPTVPKKPEDELRGGSS